VPNKRLSEEEAAAYRRDGFVPRVAAFSAEEARTLRANLEAFEAGLPPGPVDRMWRRKLHVRLPWMRDLVGDARILDAVEDLIGPDILVFNSTFFIKEPNSEAVTAWHQDATYFGLAPYVHVTAWVAFSSSSGASGCMQFIAGSHRWGQLRHEARAVANSVNNGSQTISEAFDATRPQLAPLEPGEFSLHHTLLVHQSESNRSGDRRIGVGISYIPCRVRHAGSFRMSATLVRGVDRHGYFEPEPDPRALSAQAAAEAHLRAYRRYREGYDEQIERHARQPALPSAEPAGSRPTSATR
jgi:ectoine hydroxylase-related dioxygenase (phytanoyl-CoA dioxygenase family)